MLLCREDIVQRRTSLGVFYSSRTPSATRQNGSPHPGATFCRKAGFPRGHYLCPDRPTLSPTPRPSSSPDNEDVESSAAARRLLLDVFCVSEACGQQSHGGAGVQGVSTSMPSLQEVTAGSAGDGRARKGDGGERGADERRRKLPKRLRKAAPIFASMVARARRCNFGRLLEAHCPLPEAIRRSKTLGTAVKRKGKDPPETERNRPTVPESRGRDVSTVRDGAGNNTGLVGARSQTSAAKGEGTAVLGLKGQKEDGGGDVSTTDEVCSQSSATCISTRSNGVSAHTGDGEGGDWAPASCAAKRRRLLGDDARDVVGSRSDDEVSIPEMPRGSFATAGCASSWAFAYALHFKYFSPLQAFLHYLV